MEFCPFFGFQNETGVQSEEKKTIPINYSRVGSLLDHEFWILDQPGFGLGLVHGLVHVHANLKHETWNLELGSDVPLHQSVPQSLGFQDKNDQFPGGPLPSTGF